MEISKLSIDSINELYEIYVEQFKNESWTLKQIQDSFNNKFVSFYGIYKNGELVSFASILTSIDDINLLDIATRENFKKRGYAKQLLCYIIGLKKENQTISLEVKSKNKTAISLYEKFGFKTLNIRKKYYKDGDDALCMFLV